MPLDPERVADTRAWLEKAAMDLRGAEIDLAASPPLPEDALFHCQQAVEKCLKGFLAWHDVAFRKTHSIEALGGPCLDIDPGLKDVVERAAPLTEYAWAFRYPGDAPSTDMDEARAALDLAREIFAAIAGRLPPETMPGAPGASR